MSVGVNALPVTESRSTADLILDAAERRFSANGFAGVTVRQIAHDTGLKNQASIYSHFPSKRALYEAVLARAAVPLMDLIAAGRATPPGDGAPDALDSVLDRLIDYLAEHPHVPRLIQRALLDERRALRDTANRLFMPLYQEGVRVLVNRGGPWRPDQIPFVAAGLYQLIFGYFADAALLEAVLQADPREAAAVSRQRRFLKAAVARILGGPAKPVRPREVTTSAEPLAGSDG